MPQSSTNLDLPYIQPAQAQKHITHNEAIERLDAILQLTIEAVGTTAPPGTPQEGQTWAVGVGATGDWTGQDGMLASYRGGGWLYLTPRKGWYAYVASDGQMRLYDGANWVVLSSGNVSFENLPGVGINATSDTTNRLSVAADATLLNNVGNGHQLKINKAGSAETASLLFQSAFSGRAEMGLSGTDDFAVKVSDGTNWFTGLTVQGADGTVQINQILSLSPRAEPSVGAAGDVYFDSTMSKLRCHDGTAWNDLF